MTFIARTPREELLLEALKAATTGARGSASPCNYAVWDGPCVLCDELSKDEAIGFAKGLEYVGLTYNGSIYNPVVRCGAFVVYPEERYGELVGEPGEDT